MELRQYWCIKKSGGEWALSLVKLLLFQETCIAVDDNVFFKTASKFVPQKGLTAQTQCHAHLRRGETFNALASTCALIFRISHMDMRFIWIKGIVSMQPNLNCLVQKVCLPLTRNSKVICQSTQGKIREEQGGAWKYLRNVITIHTGVPPRGTTLLS